MAQSTGLRKHGYALEESDEEATNKEKQNKKSKTKKRNDSTYTCGLMLESPAILNEVVSSKEEGWCLRPVSWSCAECLDAMERGEKGKR